MRRVAPDFLTFPKSLLWVPAGFGGVGATYDMAKATALKKCWRVGLEFMMQYKQARGPGKVEYGDG